MVSKLPAYAVQKNVPGINKGPIIACRNANSAAGGGLGDMKVHKTRLEKDKEAWDKAVCSHATALDTTCSLMLRSPMSIPLAT